MPFRILIVDDSSTTRAFIRRVIGLSGLGPCDIREADNGAAGLDVLCSLPIDVVVADINMPGMDGIEMTRRISAHPDHRAVPVVIVSAAPAVADVQKLKESGVRAVVRKPFTPEAFREVLAPILREREPGWAAPRLGSPGPRAPHADGEAIVRSAAGTPGENFDRRLLGCLTESLEGMAFIAVLPPEGETAPPDDARLVRVAFKGARDGALEIVSPATFGHQLAANVLAVAADDPRAESHASDALRELANVLCGAVLRRRGAPGYRLGKPEVVGFDAPAQWAAFVRSPGACVVDAEGSLIASRLTLA